MLYLQAHLYNRFKPTFNFEIIQLHSSFLASGQFKAALKRNPLLLLENSYSKHLDGQRNDALKLILESVECLQVQADADELSLLKLQYTILTTAGFFFYMKLYEECIALVELLSSDSFLPSGIRILCDCLAAYCYLRLSKRVLAYRYSVKVVNEWKQLPPTHLRNGYLCLSIA